MPAPAQYTVTRYMLLKVPIVGKTPGPLFAQQINQDLYSLDAHDHTTGKGQPIRTGAILLDTDLKFNLGSGPVSASFLKSLSLVQGAFGVPGSSAVGASQIYAYNGDLYWNDGAGNWVQITVGNQVNGTPGSIVGLLAPAQASWNAGAAAFSWLTNTTGPVYAEMKSGPLAIFDTASGVTKAVTIKSHASLANAYTLTLPTALPGSTLPVQLDSTGQFSTGVITKSQQAAVGQQLSSSVTFSSTSGSFVDITGLTVTITTTGRPVMVMCIDDGTGSASGWTAGGGSGTLATARCSLRIAVSGSATATIGSISMSNSLSDGGGESPPPDFFIRLGQPPAVLSTMYIAAAGTYTFQVQGSGADQWAATNVRLLAYEL